VSLDGSLRQHEVFGNRSVAATFGDQPENLKLPRRQQLQLKALQPAVRLQQALDHDRVDHGAACCDCAHRSLELPGLLDMLLQEIGSTFGAFFEQGSHVRRFGMLTQDDDSDLGTGRA
jgi:hypothetical protein